MSTRSWILAIDFGTSYTVAAALVDGRAPEVIEIEGNRRVPSVVLAEGDSFMVGKLADELSASYPGRTLRAPKRRIGDAAPIVLDGRPHQVVELIAVLLRHVHDAAVHQFGSRPSEVRLTHPAVWVRPQLNRLLEAAAMAGITNAVLVPEPVAAALAYASEVGVPAGAHVAVYDLGGGTFDTAVVTPSDAGFKIVGRPGGDNGIGGELFDELLTEHVGAHLEPATWEAIQFSDDPTWRRLGANLRAEVRRGKEMLSGYPVAEILVPVPGQLVQVRVTREEYEALIHDQIEATIDLMERCVRDAGTEPERLAAIYLVGGASRTPLITRLLEQRFPHVPISRRGDPKTSTAVGAALAVRSSDAATAPSTGVPTPPPTPIAGAPVGKPPSFPPLPPPPITPAPVGVGVLAGSPTVPNPIPAGPAGKATAPNPGAAPNGPRTLVQAPAPARRRRRRWWWLLLVLVVLGGGAAAAVVLTSQQDDGSAGDTTEATEVTTVRSTSGTGLGPLADEARCVREDIDFAALRQGPGKTRTQITRIPAGTCGVIASDRVKGDGNAPWLKVTWGSFAGFSIESNFLPAGTDPTTVTTAGGTAPAPVVTTFTVPDGLFTGAVVTGFEDFVNHYFSLATSGDPSTAWVVLSPAAQAAFANEAAFNAIWANLTAVDVTSFTGCTAESTPTSCYFVAIYRNTKGGAAKATVRFDIVDAGGTTLIDGSQLDIIGCVTKNPGENGCRAN